MKVRSKVSGLTVTAREFGRTISVGDVIDLDAIIVDTLTWRDALGVHVETAFEPVENGSAAMQFPSVDDGADQRG
jgi:hypothetical protein